MTFNPSYSMDLGNNWAWDSKKLPCKIRPESGNPAIDELRQRLSDLTGVPIPDAPAKQMKASGKKPPPGGLKPPAEGLAPIPGGGPLNMNTCNEVIDSFDSSQAITAVHEMNINKKFFRIPRAPPVKVVQDMQGVVLAQSTGEGSMPAFEEPKVLTHKPVKKKKKKKEVAKPAVQEYVPPPTPQDQVLKVRHYGGDKFGQNGNYMHGMVYLSRLPPNGGGPGLGRTRTASAGSGAGSGTGANEGLFGSKSVMRESKLGIEEPMTSDSVKALEAKLHCAATLAGWAQHDANTVRLAQEGAVDAIILLSKEEDISIQRHCANALRHMSERPMLCEQLIRNSPAQLILELVGQEAKDDLISKDCAICLVNLTRMDGIEAKLVEDAMVMALMTMLNARDELAGLCARGLFNLTCVDSSYPYIERVIKSFVSLATSATLEVKHICASGLCNLADMKELRPRLVEEGVVQCLMLLAKGAEPKTRRVCAIILHSLALTMACRGDMISKGAINVLYSLSADEDSITLHYIASGIIYLAMETQNSTAKQKTLTRLINDKGVMSLCNICMRCPTVANTTVLCAAALQLLSQHTIDANAPQIVQEGCVPALVTMLRESSDTDTLRHSLSALCNLLTSEDNHLSIIQQGGVQAVIHLTETDNSGIKETCALALFNLARGETTRDHPINTAAIPAIIQLSRLDNPVTQMRCAAALCKLAVNVNNVPLMISEGVVPAFIEMLKTENPDIVRHCCSALCCLAHEGSSCVMIAEGAGAAIIDGATKGDVTTQQACCAVISIISSQEQCRRQLVNMGALPALIALSDMNHTTTRLRCAVAFANLSAESTVQGLMVDAGVVTAVAQLSAPSPSYDVPVQWDSSVNGDDDEPQSSSTSNTDGQLNGEDHQLFCAKALCNLGCHNGSEKKIVDQGGVKALMMICMVRAVKQFTKQVCAKALLNLLNDDNLLNLVQSNDLVQVIASLSKRPTPPKKEDETLLKVCAEIFLKLSGSDIGRKELISRQVTLESVFNLMRSKDVQTQSMTGKTACNLLAHADSQSAAVAAGAVLVLKQMCMLGEEGIKQHCAWSFFLVCGKESYRQEIVKNQVLPVIILLARSLNTKTQLSCVRALCNMAYHKATRRALLESGTVAAIVRLAKECVDSEVLEMCVYILSYLSMEVGLTKLEDGTEVSYHVKMVNDDVIGAMMKIWDVLKSMPEVLRRAALTLRCLSETENARAKMVEGGSMRFLNEIVTQAQGQGDISQDELFLHAGTIIYNFCCSSSKNELINQGVLDVLAIIGGNPLCASLVSASLYLISLQKHNADKLVQGKIPELLLTLAAGEDRGTVQNCAGTFFILSKASSAVKDKLTEAGLVPMLVSLSKSPHERIRLSCSEALKNISSTGGDGIEEGTVATLITSALSGSVGNSDSIMDEALEHERPAIVPADMGAYELAQSYLPAFDDAFKSYSIPSTKHSGAAAGTGPPPPETPPMETQDEAEIKLEDEDGGEASGGGAGDDEAPSDKIMMFAKMDVPKEFLEAREG